MANSDGFTRLREHGHTAQVSLADIADDLADYAAMRPEAAQVLDGLASYLVGLHPASPHHHHGLTGGRLSAVPVGMQQAPSMAAMLPGEARDASAGKRADHWAGVYAQLVDAADITGVGADVQVHLLGRLAYWQNRVTDAALLGRRGSALVI